MSRFYVSLDDISDDKLSFLGYSLIREDGEFKLYQDYKGDEYLIRKEDPFIYVDDVNDALYLNASIVANFPSTDGNN